jgi:PhnB protein
MPKRSLAEQFDQLITQVLTGSTIAAPGEEGLRPLLAVAERLAKLPRPGFETSLRKSLMETINMPALTSDWIRAGFHTITPYIIVQRAPELAEFMKQAFGAEEEYRGTGSAGGFHIELRIGDSMLMVGGGGQAAVTPMPAALHLYVEDADAVYQQALRAGATNIRAPQDQPYGDRDASIRDPYGNEWYIATHLGENYRPEGFHAVTTYLHPHGAGQLLDWVQRALGAEEVARHESGGMLQHAQARLGSSMLEMSDAHGEFQPMPTALYLYVPNADELFERALANGGTVIYPIADQPYGDRNGGVLDPFGNHWYIGMHLGK